MRLKKGLWVEGLVLFGKNNTAVEHAASGIEDVRCRAWRKELLKRWLNKARAYRRLLNIQLYVCGNCKWDGV